MDNGTFIEQARLGRNTAWIWYIIGIIVIFIGYFLGQMPMIWLMKNLVARNAITTAQEMHFYETLDFASVGISSSVGLILILASFVFALAAMYVWIVFIIGRKFKTLITPGSINWRKIFFGFGTWFALTVLAELLLYLLYPKTYQLQFDSGKWIPLIVIALFILPLQTSFEELFVRGYLMQKIGVSFGRPWPAIIITSLVFGFMHWNNPEVREFGLGIMMTYYISVAIFLSVMTIIDNGLEFALGIHAATNIYGAAFVSYQGSALQTDSMIRVTDINPMAMLLLFYVSVVIFLLLVRFRYSIRNYGALFERPLQPSTAGEAQLPG